MADENVGTISYTLDAKTEGLVEANKKANASINEFEKRFQALGNESGKLDKKLKLTSDQVNKLNGWVKDANGSLRDQSGNLVTASQKASVYSRVILKSSNNSRKLSFNMKKVASGVGKATDSMKKGALVATALAGALAAIVKTSASTGQQLQQMAQLSNVSVERFQELAYGASQLGISTEKLGDIFKDTQDKVGDFINTGGGELKDYFTNIAPLVGQTAEQFKNLSGPDALKLFQKGLDAANISASEQIFYLESLANDASLLKPLLKDNAKGFEDAANEARNLNLVLSETEVKEIAEVNREFNKLLATIAKMTQKIVAENGPQIRQAIKEIIDIVINGGNAIRDLFVELGGGSDIAKVEANIRKVSVELDALQKLTKKDYVLNVKTPTNTEFNETAKKLTDLNDELDRLRSDDQINAESKIKIERSLLEKISLLNGDLFVLGEQVNEDYSVYVDAQTGKAQDDLMLLNGELETLKQSTESPLTIEINKGAGQDEDIQKTALGVINFNKIDTGNIPSVFEQGATIGTDSSGASAMNIALQEGIGLSRQMAEQVETIDKQFQNLSTTMADTLVGAAYSFSDAAGQGLAQAIADGDSLNDTLRNVAGTIGTQLLGNLITMGLQYGINAALKSSADTAMAASGIAATQAQAASSVAASAEVAAAAAPAAAATATWSFGGAALAAAGALAGTFALTKALSGGRLNGGPVSAGSAYEVTENGKPEMLTVGGKNILMMGNQSGKVTSNKDMMSGGGGMQVINNVYNNSSGASAETSSRMEDGKLIIDTVVADLNSRGKIHKTLTNTTTANNKV